MIDLKEYIKQLQEIEKDVIDVEKNKEGIKPDDQIALTDKAVEIFFNSNAQVYNDFSDRIANLPLFEDETVEPNIDETPDVQGVDGGGYDLLEKIQDLKDRFKVGEMRAILKENRVKGLLQQCLLFFIKMRSLRKNVF